jgi:hypothetical protein
MIKSACEGWPVVFATDLAFGYVLARVIFGRHPVIPLFVLPGICGPACPSRLEIGTLQNSPQDGHRQ